MARKLINRKKGRRSNAIKQRGWWSEFKSSAKRGFGIGDNFKQQPPVAQAKPTKRRYNVRRMKMRAPTDDQQYMNLIKPLNDYSSGVAKQCAELTTKVSENNNEQNINTAKQYAVS
ncbi:MAG: hypothetical protein RLZZ86_2689 [Cyanobacteriota bacterium]